MQVTIQGVTNELETIHFQAIVPGDSFSEIRNLVMQKAGVDNDYEELTINKLPSEFQIGDNVNVVFLRDTVTKCQVIRVHFSESKVLYDLEISIKVFGRNEHTGTTSQLTTRIYNIDSCFVEPADGTNS